MATHISCECGRRFGVRDEQIGRNLRCPFCGQPHRLNHQVSSGERPVEAKQRRMPWWENREALLWIGLASGLLIFAVLSVAFINRYQRISADREVSRMVAEAEALIGENRHDEAISLLEHAIGTHHATDFTAARERLHNARVAKGDYDDSRFIKTIERSLKAGQVETAVDSLSRRVPAMRDPNKSRAAAIIENVSAASSRDGVLERLSHLSDDEIEDAAAVESIVANFQTDYEPLREQFRQSVFSVLEDEKAGRKAAREKAQAERLAKLEQERQKKLQDEKAAKEAEEKRLAEEARVASERKAKDAARLALEERLKRSFTGSGDEATADFDLASGLAVITLRHRGLKNFAVWLLDDEGKRVDLLANVIGPCSISTALHIPKEGPYLLDIKADGQWQIVVSQPLPHDADFEFFFGGDRTMATQQFKLLRGLCKIKLKHRGERNFVVRLLDDEGRTKELVVNTIGSYDGSRAVRVEDTGTYLFAVTADGEWSIEIDR